MAKDKKQETKKQDSTKEVADLGKVLKNVLQTPILQTYDVRDEAAMQDSGEETEPMDKVMVAIQHHLINQDWDKANQLIQSYKSGRKIGSFFSYYHLDKLIDWVRSIYKYTDVRDLSKNYYDYQIKQEIPGVSDLRKVKVKDEHITKFMKDVEKVLTKKLEMR
jgi:hypothetical protein